MRRVHSSAPPSHHGGFTLIELMVTVTVLAVLLGVAVPMFGDFVSNQKVKTAAYDVSSALIMARSEAIKRNTSVSISAAAGGWADGWKVATTAGATTVLEQSPIAGVAISAKDTANSSVSSLAFQANGRLSTGYSFTMTGNSTSRCVSIAASGVPTSKSGACS